MWEKLKIILAMVTASLISLAGCANKPSFLFSVAELMDVPASTPLYDACAAGDMEKIMELVKAGEDVSYAPGGLEYPIEIFCASGTGAGLDALKCLLDAGADPNAYKYTPALFRVAQSLKHRDPSTYETGISMVMALLDAGADWVDPEDGNSIIHYAALQKDTSLLSTLLAMEEGSILSNEKNHAGETPKDWAEQCGNAEAVSILDEGGRR